jgi:hypothetical protein
MIAGGMLYNARQNASELPVREGEKTTTALFSRLTKLQPTSLPTDAIVDCARTHICDFPQAASLNLHTYQH